MRGVPHHFLGHAAHVHAGAAQPAGLDDHRPGSVGGRAPGAGDPAAAAADDRKVESCHGLRPESFEGERRSENAAERKSHISLIGITLPALRGLVESSWYMPGRWTD